MKSPKLFNVKAAAALLSLGRSGPLGQVLPSFQEVPRLTRGFTLIEIIVVIALVGLIAAMGTIIGFDTLSRSSVHEERDLLVTLLTGVRAKALANVNQKAHGLQITADEFILFEGTPSDPNARHVDRNANIQVDPGVLVDVVFEQLSGASDDKTITLSQDNKSQTVEINAAGRIEW